MKKLIYIYTSLILLIIAFNAILYICYINFDANYIYNKSPIRLSSIEDNEADFYNIPDFGIEIPLLHMTDKESLSTNSEFSGKILSSFEISYVYGEKNVHIVIENNSSDELKKINNSLLRRIFFDIDMSINFTEYKKDILNHDIELFSWWNIINNIRLCLNSKIIKENLPESLRSISYIIVQNHDGFFEEHEIDSSKLYGYNFCLGSSCYNIIFIGLSSTTEALEWVRRVRITKGGER